MSAPFLWIIVPIVLGALLLFITNQRALSVLGGSAALGLALIAQFVPIELAMKLGPLSVKIDSSLTVLGRVLADPAFRGPPAGIDLRRRRTLVLRHGSLQNRPAHGAHRLHDHRFDGGIHCSGTFPVCGTFHRNGDPACHPHANLDLQTPGRGVVRFLIYQTLAMPFILLAGWLLGGVEASPGDLALAAQSAAMLGLGFAFLLAIFPLYSWIPLLLEETSPYIVGFLLWILPTMTLIFGAGFLDRYSWLRSSEQLILALRFIGLLMVVSGGAFAAFQRHLGRIMGYGAIAETGFSLLALSLDFKIGIPILFLLIPARALGLAVWSLSLTIIRENVETMRFGAARGILRVTPLAGAGMIVATLSTGAFPLLAGFPARLALWEGLSHVFDRFGALVDGGNYWAAHQRVPFPGSHQRRGGVYNLGTARKPGTNAHAWAGSARTLHPGAISSSCAICARRPASDVRTSGALETF